MTNLKNDIIVFAHPKGGSGKTASCMNTTIEFLYEGYDPIVIDQDNQQQMTKFNINRNKHNLQTFKQFKPNDEESFKKFLETHQGLKIVDTGGFDSKNTRIAAVAANLIIIPLNGSDQELDGFADFKRRLNQIIELNPKLKIRVLVNRVHYNNKSKRKLLVSISKSIKNCEVLNTIVPLNMAYETMLFSGEAIRDKKLDSNNPYKAIQNYIEEIKEAING